MQLVFPPLDPAGRFGSACGAKEAGKCAGVGQEAPQSGVE